MKKIISVILTTILIITGCTKKYEIEEIIWFKISYYTSIEKKMKMLIEYLYILMKMKYISNIGIILKK